ERFSLPPRLVRLNAGLFSMHGERHRTHQHLLMTFLRRSNVAEYGTAILRGWNAFKEDLVHDRDLHLLSEMRRLVLNISGRIVFGNDGVDLGRSIQKYFEDRRDFSKAEAAPCPHDSSSREIRRELVRSGLRLDGMLRARLAELQNGPGAKSAGEPECMFRKLAHLQYDNGTPLSPEDLVAHANILFMSGSEPMAVALTWTLLLLSQQPEVLQNARKEVATVFEGRQPPPYFAEAELPTVRAIVLESLRLLPPNAIMVRLSTRETDILGHRLPRRCEVVLSPYVAHRDQRDWENPDHFDPRRWAGLNPSPYCYLPFGAGNRFCLGKHFATSILVSILARIVRDYDLTLAAEQSIDWKMHINLMPAEDPVIRFSPAGS